MDRYGLVNRYSLGVAGCGPLVYYALDMVTVWYGYKMYVSGSHFMARAERFRVSELGVRIQSSLPDPVMIDTGPK